MMRRVVAILFAVVFYPILAIYSCVAVAFLTAYMVLTAPFFSHVQNMHRFRRLMCRYGTVIIHVLVRPMGPVIYKATPRDTKTAKIIVSNHVSASDPFLVACLPEVFVQVVNTWPFKLPLWGVFARWSGYLNVKQLTPEAFMEESAKLLREGTSIVSFPEGTRAGEGPIGPFHSSIFRVALATHVSIVPMCILGNARSPARGSLLLEPATVRVHCLPEITWDVYQSMTPFQLKNHVRDLIQQEVERMKTL
jgi:1-acyl-sn-glycerol-3-phosphate acyltransferase